MTSSASRSSLSSAHDSAEWDLLRQIAIPGGWRAQEVEIDDQRWQLLMPADQHAFLAASPVTDKWPDPYWTQIWPAARTLVRMILAHPWPAHTRVLEVGCGSGFVGLAALAWGCHVTFSDYVPLAVELAVANARANGYPQVAGETLDWNLPGAEPKFPVILACEVIYDVELHQALLNTLAARLDPGGFCWLVEPGRGDTAPQFLQRALAAGWQITFVDEQGQPATGPAQGQFRRWELRR
jgi:predicted nicotinamide N-methyase